MCQPIIDIDKFSQFTQSLKGVGDAEECLSSKLLKKFYVDSFDANHGLIQMKQNDSTFIIGKKGTGKSTLLSRFKLDLKDENDRIAIYIDTKSLFDRPVAMDPSLQGILDDYNHFQENIKKLFNTMNTELQEQDSLNNAIKREIQSLINDINFEEEIIRFEQSRVDEINQIANNNGYSGNISVGLQNLCLRVMANHEKNTLIGIHKSYIETVIKKIDPIEIMDKLKMILKRNSISKVFICFDDFSEISLDSMTLIMDIFIAPLHNKADNFYKFKISAYPGRLYLGSPAYGIGIAGISYLKLDFFERTKELKENIISSDLKKLKVTLEKRLQYYFGDSNILETIIDQNEETNFLYKVLFVYTFNNLRLIGKIFNNIQRIALIRNRVITSDVITDAAIECFSSIASDFFTAQLVKYQSFNEQLSFHNLHQIFDFFLQKAKENFNSPYFRSDGLYGNIFYIEKKYESFLQSLELGYLIFKLREIEKRDKTYSFYTLNCAFCKREGITTKVEVLQFEEYLRKPKYSDFTSLLIDFISDLNVYICDTCGNTQEIAEASVIQKIGYKCFTPDCHGRYNLEPKRIVSANITTPDYDASNSNL